ncbi:unnamed protein product [Mytilus edulis]|uniref:G-protein coupled receptors family 1 profile domain-containing protein n=1 Tax=Mytilus edulis TaxID=6550 RepID=A0A8S3UTZ6_MYTED|nr:unnamed protein product [Mytilus edulis]
MIANGSISNQTDEFIEDEITRIIFVYVSPCVIFIGTVANILSILVLSKKTMRRSTTMFYLLILSSADLLVLYTGLLRYWIIMAFDIDIRLHSDFICKLHAFLVYFSLDFASWILVAVTMDRCISVMRPLKARLCCTHNVSKVIVVVLVVAMVFINSHLFFTVEIIARNGPKLICQEADANFVSKIWPWIDFAVFCFVPFGIMIVANSLIIQRVSASVKTLKNMTVDNNLGRSFDSVYTRRTSFGSSHISGEHSDEISTITEACETQNGFSNDTVNKTANNNSTRLQTSTNVTVMLLVKTSESDVKKLTSQVSELNNTCDSFNIKLDELNAEKDNLWIAQASGGSGSPGKGSKLKKEIAEIHKQNSELKSTVSDLQYEATKNNLIFYGIVDMPGEDVQNLLSGFVRYEMDVKTNINFRSVRRMNSKFKPRPIIATFDNFKQREVVKSSAYKLKSSPFGLSVQYTPDVLAKRKQLLPIQREARAQQAKAVMIRDKLYINNELFDQIKHKQFLPKMETQIPNEKIEDIVTSDKNLFIACVYIPPVRSNFYKLYNCDLFVDLENSIELYSSLGDVILLGDTNSRTGAIDDFVSNDSIHSTIRNRLDDIFDYSADIELNVRNNPDNNTNCYGPKLISLCKASGLRILNGRHKNGFANDFTFCGANGMSVIDYLLVPVSLFPIVRQLIVSNFTTFSDHAFLHIQLSLLCNKQNSTRFPDDENREKLSQDKFKWNDELKEQCRDCLLNNMEKINMCRERIDFDGQQLLDNSLDEFTSTLNDIMAPFFKKRTINFKSCRSNICDDKPWFNAQCKDLHRRYINCLNIFNRLKSQLNHSNLIRAKKDYKTLERRLKQEYMRTEGNMLDIMRLTNPKLFYKKFKRKASPKHAVPLKLFHEHFKSLCSSDTDAVLDDSQFNNTDGECDITIIMNSSKTFSEATDSSSVHRCLFLRV